jgi:2'-5' RNA ligase
MAFLGIQVPHETGRLLSKLDVSGEKSSIDEMHITLLYFQDEWPISKVSEAMEVAYEIISKTHPFSVKMEKVTHFPINKHDQDKYPVITRVESKELHKLRESLAKKFDKEGIEFSKLHPDFKPHITLSYCEEKPDHVDFHPIEFTVSEVVLWGGDHGDDRIFITFPLAGPDVSKNGSLLQKIDIFEKMAGNPLQDATY